MKIQVKIAVCIVTAAALLQGCATVKPADTPEEQFKAGERYFKKENYDDAIVQWKKVKESYQSQELSTQAEISIADAYFLNKDYIEAAGAYDDFRKMHPKHEKAGFALYRQGLSHYNQIHSIDTDQTPVKNALQTLESYLTLYPGGEQTAEVKEKIALCKDKQLQYEIYVGRFYLRTDKYPAAIARFEDALKAFPDAPRRDEVLYYLGKSYMEAGQKPKAFEAYQRLVKEFPSSQYASKVPRDMPPVQFASVVEPPKAAPVKPAPVAAAPPPSVTPPVQPAPAAVVPPVTPPVKPAPAAVAAPPGTPLKSDGTPQRRPKQDRN
jgi:outer membrane protein assembly factor BamD